MTFKTNKLIPLFFLLISSISFDQFHKIIGEKNLHLNKEISNESHAYHSSKLIENKFEIVEFSFKFTPLMTDSYVLDEGFTINHTTKINFQTSCASPTNVNLSNITPTSVDVSWSASASEVNGYEWVVMLDGDTPDPGNAFATGNLSSGTTNTSISNLNDDTTYDFYIRTLCANPILSSWSTAESFTTPITPAKINLLLYRQQSFDNGDSEADALGINFKPNGNNAVNQFDAAKLSNPDENLARYNNGSFLSIENRAMPADNELLTLNVWNYTTSNYVFIAEVFDLPQDIDAYIVDQFTGDYHKITNGSNQINFSVNSSNSESVAVDRFSIDFDVNPCPASSVWTGANWNNGMPDANTKALFTADHTQAGTIETCDVEVRTGAKLTIKGVLKLNGSLKNDGDVIFSSDSNGTGQLDQVPLSASIDPNIQVERFIPVQNQGKRGFRFLTSSVNSTNPIYDNWQEGGNSPAGYGTHISGDVNGNHGFDATISGNPSMYTFDNTFTGNQNNAWNPIPNTDNTNLEAGKAYRIFLRGDRNYNLNALPGDADYSPNSDVTLRATGSLVKGDHTLNLNQVKDLYSLIGNPYQAIVDMNDVILNSNNVNSNYYWVWDSNLSEGGAYVTVDLSDGSNPGTSAANQFVMPGQSFFVQTSNDGSADITFTEASKNVTATPTAIFSENNAISLNLKLYKTTDLDNQESESDAIQINFSDQYSNSVTPEDAGKLGNPEENIAIKNNDEYLSIEKRAMPVDNESITIYTDGYTVNDYTFVLTANNLPNDLDAYLIDHFTGNQTLLQAGENQISFTVDQSSPASLATDRFSIDFETATFGVDDQEFEGDFKVYPNPVVDSQVSIQSSSMSGEARVSLFNMIGQRVWTRQKSFENGEASLDIGEQAGGVYFLEVNQDGQTLKERLIIK